MSHEQPSQNSPLSLAMIAACPFPTRQGTQVTIKHLAHALADRGHDVHLCTYGYGEYEEPDVPHLILHRTKKIDAGFRSGPHPLRPAADAALGFTAGRVAKAHACDLLHVHNVEGLAIGAMLKLQSGKPLIYHAHNTMELELPTYYRNTVAQSFFGLVGRVIDHSMPRIADAVIVFDERQKEIHQEFGIAPERIHVVAPGLDLREMSKPDEILVDAWREKLGPGKWLLYAGNPDRYQNLELLAEALRRISKRDTDAKLLVLTHHNADNFSVFEPELRERIHFESFESTRDLAAAHQAVHLALCPRAIHTGFPIKVINYLAAGLPVVGLRSSLEAVLPELGDSLVDNDAEAFCQAILRSSKGDAKPELAQRFAVQDQMNKYETIYREVL
ncbi:MAG: glycosyltransferase family 4 protein [Myxococcota bacterium]|nr:glycosyltransferase family 4 protein [Myxococcota bacterium]